MKKNKKRNKEGRLLKLAAAVLVLVLLALVGVVAHLERQQRPDETLPEESLPEMSATAGQTNPAEPSEPATGVVETEPEETEPEETKLPGVLVTVPDIEGTYEHWLAAAMYYIPFMDYPEYTVVGLYTRTATVLEKKMDSDGVYMLLSNGVEELLFHSAPLADHRTEKGTTDLHTAQLGYATFDRVDAKTVDLATMISLDPESLAEMMSYTGLPGLYSR